MLCVEGERESTVGGGGVGGSMGGRCKVELGGTFRVREGVVR